MVKVFSHNRRKIALLFLLLFYFQIVGNYVYASFSFSGNSFPTIPVEIGSFGFTDLKNSTSGIMKAAAVESTKYSTAGFQPEIGGPGQPEMNSFRSVSADDMVNLFTGDFSYNIPLLDVGGYPVNLFYNAGITMNQEASWVGLGWNLNPGTISRNMRGLPDDFDGTESITKIQSMKPDLTIGVTGKMGGEVTGVPGLSINVTNGIFYNNKRGLGLEKGIGGEFSVQKQLAGKNKTELTRKDTLKTFKISGGIDLNSQNGMSANLRASYGVTKFIGEKQTSSGFGTSIAYSSRKGLTDLRLSGELSKYKAICDNNVPKMQLAANYSYTASTISFGRSAFTPSIRMPITTSNHYYAVKLGQEFKVVFPNGEVGGYLTESRIDKDDQEQKKPAYGFMYVEKASEDKSALLDFNRIHDGVYTYKTPVISSPVYTYDVFTISGEGTGGSFRGYRGSIGYVRDHDSRTKSSSVNVTLDLGGGDIFHGGTVIGGVYTPSMVTEWKDGNTLTESLKFNGSDSVYQGFYFKNPGEKAIIDEDYYNNIGGDKLVRPYLTDLKTASPILAGGIQVFSDDKTVESTKPLNSLTAVRKERDKRAQVITYLTAEDADLVGLDRYINSYKENSFKPGSCDDPNFRTKIKRYNPNDPTFYRKSNHISEVAVLEGDGKRYVYGIPVYQIHQKEVSFSIDQQGDQDQLVGYVPGEDNTVENNKGRDGLFESEEIPGYAHSFLLTAILSPDYVDVKGDGITEDDLGSNVKFNYSRISLKSLSIANTGLNVWANYKWRLPFEANKAHHNEGLKTDVKDDKGMYTYGEKELWYLHTIESKNMIATFHISNRNDGRSVIDENGGVSTNATGLKKLDKISLYTKADYLKYGAAAKPIKTVHFKYSYSLCKGYGLNPHSQDGGGKLTLDSLWFTYNGKNVKKNKYVFKYDDEGNPYSNPNYKSSEYDRWSSYKPASGNPNQLTNAEYPYSTRNATLANQYAAAWNLKKILLPSGAEMEVTYESDDYAFVQNRRASEMIQIAGFGKATTSEPSNRLYNWESKHAATPGLMDNKYVFIDLPQPLNNYNEISRRYLQDLNQLLLKLCVKVPSDNNGGGAESIVVYATVKSYGFAPAPNGGENKSRIYFELESMSNGGSPVMATVMQFLKDLLPSKAYPGYDVKSSNAVSQMVGTTLGMVSGFMQAMLGFERDLKSHGKCKEVVLEKSFVRLNNPAQKKLGGGHRVKKITVSDNWDKLTAKGGTGETPAKYGQEYHYTTRTDGPSAIDISSGVASYEPGIGNEENPFREVLKYSHKQFLGPTDHMNVETPIAEALFPSPYVGYSRVLVRSIHNKSNKNLRSGIGFQVTEFYTSKEFPVIVDHTYFDPASRKHHTPSPIQRIFNFSKKDYLTLTQGIRVILNDMNGKMKSQSSYSDLDDKTPVNYTAWYYKTKKGSESSKRLDNVVDVVTGPEGNVKSKLVGKEVELMVDFREHLSYTYSGQIPLNAEFFMIGNFPVLIPTVFNMLFREESMFRSATTMKIVTDYGILDSVVNVDKGSVVGTKNLLYDQENGNVLLSKVDNQFGKSNYQFNYPAGWAYTGVDAAYKNIDLTYKNVNFKNGLLHKSDHVNKARFESGDEIFVVHSTNRFNLQNPECIAAGNYPFLAKTNEYRIWVIDVTKDPRNSVRELIFVDRNGTPYNANNATIRVIRSGKRNLIGASVGSVTSLNSPVTLGPNNTTILSFTNTTDVLNSSVTEYKDRWRANDMFYAVTEMTQVTRQAPVRTLTATPIASASVTKHSWNKTTPFNLWQNWQTEHYFYYNQDFFSAKQSFRKKDREVVTKSWLNFDLSAISIGSKILDAKLSIYSHKQISPSNNNSQGFHWLDPDWQSHQSTHGTIDPHHGNNSFTISRLLTSWGGNVQGTWEGVFYNPNSVDNYTRTFQAATATPLNAYQNDKSYCSTCNGYDSRIDVSPMVAAMVADRDNPARNFATAIQLDMANHTSGGDVKRICFNSGVQEGQQNKPTLNIKYYNCSEAYGLPGNPSGPEPGQEVTTCTTTELVTSCYSVFDKKQMNPYIEGILGNWRSFKSYVFYGERRKTDPLNSTNIRVDGVIKDFETYWTFNTVNLGRSGSAKWVWNTEVLQFNRKGAELENKDALNRFNSAVYGYQESLPIAVANNSRLQNIAYDGFEDYTYKDDPCQPICTPGRRHFNSEIQSSFIDGTEAHTGSSSLKVPVGTDRTIELAVSSTAAEYETDLRIKLDKTPVTQTAVVPKGYALKGYYYYGVNFNTLATTRKDNVQLMFDGKDNSNRCKDRGNLPAVYDNRCGEISVQWKGKFQAPVTGTLELSLHDDNNEGWIYLNNVLVSYYEGTSGYSTPISVTAGTLYDIKVDYKQVRGPGQVMLKWKLPQGSLVAIDPKYLYPEGEEALAVGTVTTSTIYCTMPDTIQAIKNHLTTTLGIVQGEKIVASTWIKKGGQDCNCDSYNATIIVTDDNNNEVTRLKPKSVVIEGWQLYEEVITVPTTSKLKIIVKGTAGTMYVDDFRVHPFNSNMKSFVYDPITLRLVSELDENNYATFYEYDDEGSLVRVKKETKEGIKTISETRSSMQKKITGF